MSIDTTSLLADEARYCSFGDTVHYVNPPKIFTGCEGSYMYDDAGTAYLDLQMWYSAVNFGYKNKRLEQKMIEQLQSLPQVASQYLHPTKIELAKFIGMPKSGATRAACASTWAAGHRGFAQGRAQRQRRQEPDVRLRGRLPRPYAGRLQHHLQLPLSPPLRPLPTVQFIPFPYPFRRPKGMTAEEYSDSIVKEFARKFENEYHAIWDPKTNQCSTRPSTSSPSRALAATSCRRRISSGPEEGAGRSRRAAGGR